MKKRGNVEIAMWAALCVGLSTPVVLMVWAFLVLLGVPAFVQGAVRPECKVGNSQLTNGGRYGYRIGMSRKDAATILMREADGLMFVRFPGKLPTQKVSRSGSNYYADANTEGELLQFGAVNQDWVVHMKTCQFISHHVTLQFRGESLKTISDQRSIPVI
jgi:hypothetical protein